VKLFFISNCYIFDGTGAGPWQPDCNRYATLNAYGQSKLAGELEVQYCRICIPSSVSLGRSVNMESILPEQCCALDNHTWKFGL